MDDKFIKENTFLLSINACMAETTSDLIEDVLTCQNLSLNWRILNNCI